MSNARSEGARRWAQSQFGHIDLGDARRTARLVEMGAGACERPSGKVAAVFTTDRHREGAYDWLENPDIDADEITAGLAVATVRQCEGQPFVFVPTDGTSVTVTDRSREKDFGRIGSDTNGARGLKVIDALAVDPQGIPVGLLALTWWARQKSAPKTVHARQSRPLEEKETRHWVKTVQTACAALDEGGVRGWFQIDREGDSVDVLSALQGTTHWWTVRGNANRSIEIEGGNVSKLRAELAQQTPSGTYTLQVVARPKRQAREARMVVRVAQTVLRLRNKRTDRITKLTVTTVWAREEGTTPVSEDPIDWLLYTNRPVETFDDATFVLYGYAQRWKVEEFHRTWKRGECDIESTQLDSFAAVQRWA
jgi:hypothetical protein